ncbi:MAG: hypothetical protein H7126_11655 [Candidatus Parcubacteria bacterium]|uniref:hypothetical protein n=1 Tax=Phormidesmis priestleyi TaxID=268141 RepID=UPI00083B4909|nr:hypothetical protein [Phormidesmis priestleyi]MBC7824506.1 hypothetical protein [Leptolyngbyaceae cyanobacterium LF-bin-113]
MVQAPQFPANLAPSDSETLLDLGFQLPDPEDEQILDLDFQQQIEKAWQVCDRVDLQTDIWRGRILKTVRDREKKRGEGRGVGFLNWLKDREISKSQAYSLIELANSADTLLESGCLEPEDVNQFTKRAFVETAQAAPEVQQMIGDTARKGDRITRREVRQLSDDWTAMTSDLLPVEVREKAADQTIPTRYLAPLVRQLEKLPESHQVSIRDTVAQNPDVDTLKQVTSEARYLTRYLEAATHVQALSNDSLDLELALEEALRLGCLNSTAELVSQAAQLEQAIAKLYTTWKRINTLSDRVYVDTGASSPHLRTLLSCLNGLTSNSIEFCLGDPKGEGFSRTIRLQLEDDQQLSEVGTWE